MLRDSLGDRPRGRGIRNIKARAEELGGTADIVSQEGSGTEVGLSIPLG